MNSRNDETGEDLARNGDDDLTFVQQRHFAITGLGVVLALVIALWFLAHDGTLPFTFFSVSLAVLIPIACVLAWRIVVSAQDPEESFERSKRRSHNDE
jgi:hypothetical protein